MAKISLVKSETQLVFSIPGILDEKTGKDFVFSNASPGPLKLDETKLTPAQKAIIEDALKKGKLLKSDKPVAPLLTLDAIKARWNKCEDRKSRLEVLSGICLSKNALNALSIVTSLIEDECHKTGKIDHQNIELLRGAFQSIGKNLNTMTTDGKNKGEYVAYDAGKVMDLRDRMRMALKIYTEQREDELEDLTKNIIDRNRAIDDANNKKRAKRDD